MNEIEVKNMPEYDVIVVGGGVAGIAAAVAASRNGAKTLLMEKTVMLGGLATIGLISWYEPLCDGEGKKMISGISEELIKLAVKYGFENLPKKWGGSGKNPIHYERYATRFSPNIFALALIEYLEENGVDLRFDTLATYPKVENGFIKGILVETFSGREFFHAKMIVDASGDATVCHRAGIPTELGENYFTYFTHEIDIDEVKELAETGDFAKGRHWRCGGSDLFGNGHPDGMPTIKVTSDDVITDYMKMCGKAVLNRLKKSDKESRDILMAPLMPQFRKIRRIIGESEFCGNEDDMRFDNEVGSFGDFRKPGRHFELPYTCLYNKAVKNLYAAGRIISAKGDGWEITRVIPVAAFTGEVAGTAAALCVKNGTYNDNLDVSVLQKTLKNAGVLFE